MSFYSDRLTRIKLSPSTAATMRAQGHDIIALTIGQPDFNTPEHVTQGVMGAGFVQRLFQRRPAAGAATHHPPR